MTRLAEVLGLDRKRIEKLAQLPAAELAEVRTAASEALDRAAMPCCLDCGSQRVTFIQGDVPGRSFRCLDCEAVEEVA